MLYVTERYVRSRQRSTPYSSELLRLKERSTNSSIPCTTPHEGIYFHFDYSSSADLPILPYTHIPVDSYARTTLHSSYYSLA